MAIKSLLSASVVAALTLGSLGTASAATFDSGTLGFQYYSYGGAYDNSGSPEYPHIVGRQRAVLGLLHR